MRWMRIATIVGFAVLVTGCATTERHPMTAFYQYDYDYAVKGFRAEVGRVQKEKEDRNIVLANLNYAGAAVEGGAYSSALDGLGAAAKLMEDVEYGAQRGQASMVLAHDMRVYKGEPYERALAYSYMGVIYFRRGDYENARAAFNLALLADRSSKGDNEDYRDDFALAHYLIGKTYLKLGEADNAGISFGKVAKYMPGNPFASADKVRDSNFTLLVEMGCGPYKKPDIIVGTVDMIGTCNYPDHAAEVYVDGQLLGRTAKLVDLNYQAKTSGSSGRDVAQAAKGIAVAVAKQVPLVGGLIGLAADASGVSKADLRHWGEMPGEVHVIEAKIPEGLHTVQIKFFDATGNRLERFDQVHYFVPVGVGPEGAPGENLFIVRSGLDRHNVVRPKEAAYLGGGILTPQQRAAFGSR